MDEIAGCPDLDGTVDALDVLLEYNLAVFDPKAQFLSMLCQFDLDLGLDRSQLLRQHIELCGHGVSFRLDPVTVGAHGRTADATHSSGENP